MKKRLILCAIFLLGCWDGKLSTTHPVSENVLSDLEFAARQLNCETEISDHVYTSADSIMINGEKKLPVLRASCEEGTVFFHTCCRAAMGLTLENVKVACGGGLTEKSCGVIANKIIEEARRL